MAERERERERERRRERQRETERGNYLIEEKFVTEKFQVLF